MGQRRRSHLGSQGHRVTGARADDSDDNADEEVTSCGERHSLFPAWAHWAVLAVTLAFRLTYVTQRRNWWILHPDEIYQGIEVAFSLLHGYGFRMYEYLPPFTNTSCPAADREAHLGFHSLRSFLYPRLLAGLTNTLEALGFAGQPFVTLKSIHAAVAASLCYAVYKFTRSLASSHDAGVLAAIFAVTSLPLAVFGTHSLTNSFVAPFFFVALIPLASLLSRGTSGRRERGEHSLHTPDSSVALSKRNGLFKGNSALRKNPKTSARDTGSNGKDKVRNGMNGNIPHITDSSQVHHASAATSRKASNRNGISRDRMDWSKREDSLDSTGVFKKRNGFVSSEKLSSTRREYIGVLCLLNSCLRSIVRLEKGFCSLHTEGYLSAGFVMGLMCYIRVDLVLSLVCFLISLAFFTLITNVHVPMPSMTPLILYASGTMGGLLLGGYSDYHHYGYWFLSPVQWIRFNVIQKLSGEHFGVGAFSQYIGEFVDRPSCLFLNLLCLVYVVMIFLVKCESQTKAKPVASALTTTVVSLTLAYGLQGHKELRFLHNVFVFQAVLWGLAVHGVVKICRERIPWFSANCAKMVMLVVLLMHALDSYRHFPASYDKSNQDWAYGKVWDSALANECLEKVGNLKSVRGILLDYSLYSLGGFSLLVHNVPVLARLHYEYFEYHPGDLPDYRREINPNLRVINRMTDVIHVRHEEYLRVVVSGNLQYNMVLTASPQRFTGVGFLPAFRCGHIHVLRKDDNMKVPLRDRLKDGLIYTKDPAILEVEGSWLYSVGHYSKAVTRLSEALSHSTERVRPYQLLAMSQAATGDLAAARQTERACWKQHGVEACRRLQPRLVLHHEYQ